jgi:nucleotide-binding universal stress UspA family protein
MFRSILVPLDASRFAEAALPLATRLAQSAQARLHLVLAHQPQLAVVGVGEMVVPPIDLGTELRVQEGRYLSDIATSLGRHGVTPLEVHAVEGIAGPEICDVATRIGADLIVMATHGRGAIRRFWLGSVADYLVRHLTVPVLLVHPDRVGQSNRDRPISRILVALDLSKESEAILEPVTALALLAQAHVTLIHAVGPYQEIGTPVLPYPVPPDPNLLESYAAEAQRKLDAIASRLRERGLSVATRVPVGMSRAGTLLAVLEEEPFDLIAMTTHGGGTMRRLVLGSVADHVVRGASKPVLVMRPAV